jgi:glycosyltransferase involved in cell wall biosynthesis
VRLYFSAADLVVQPYKSATQSGVTQIAYHFVRPMLVTRVGGLAEIVPAGKAGYVCEVDEKAVADALVDYVSHRDDQAWNDRLHRNIEIEKQKYAWSRMTAAILNSETSC